VASRPKNKREEEVFFFSETEFSRAFQIHFQEILNSFSSLVKTNQHNRKYAAA